jgi:hypothetical protein
MRNKITIDPLIWKRHWKITTRGKHSISPQKFKIKPFNHNSHQLT